MKFATLVSWSFFMKPHIHTFFHSYSLNLQEGVGEMEINDF